jgi:hypothetical protein
MVDYANSLIDKLIEFCYHNTKKALYALDLLSTIKSYDNTIRIP